MTLQNQNVRGHKSPVGKRTGRKVHKKRKKTAGMRWEKYAFLLAGVLCMLFAVIGVASLIKGQDAKAAETLTKVEWSELGENIPFNDGTLAADTGIELYRIEGTSDYAAFVKTEAQMRHVVSGLASSWTSGNAGNGSGCDNVKVRSAVVHFRLSNNIDYTYQADFLDFNESGYYDQPHRTVKTNYDSNNGGYSTDATSKGAFINATFDGQGHTIHIKGNVSDSLRLLMDASTDHLVSWALLFPFVSDARIENLTVINSASVSLMTFADDKNVTDEDTKVGVGAGIGVLCGSAVNTVFEDITIVANKSLDPIVNTTGDELRNKYMQVGIGGIAGCMMSSVEIRRCESNLLSSVRVGFEESKGPVLAACGAIAGMAIDSDNVIIASGCRDSGFALDQNQYTDHQSYKNIASVSGEILGMAGNIAGHKAGNSPSVKLTDCIIHGEETRAIGARSKAYDNDDYNPWNTAIDSIINLRCYGETSNVVYAVEDSRNIYTRDDGKTLVIEVGPSEAKSSVEMADIDGAGENWYYDALSDQHLLKDQYRIIAADGLADGHDVVFAPPEMLDPENEQIRVKANLQNWMTDEATKNAKAELYVSWDGTTDPKNTSNIVASVSNHPAGTNGTDVQFLSPENYEQLKFSEGKVIRARVKVILNPSTKDEKIFWSGMSERQYSILDTLIEPPVLKLQEETDTTFSVLKENHVYGLGTTKWQLSPADGKSYDMYWMTHKDPNLVLGETDTESTIKPDTVLSTWNYYKSSLSVTEEMLSRPDSNRIYLYVLAYASVNTELEDGTQDVISSYKLYRFDILAYKADTLMISFPENGSRIPVGSDVIFRVGNKKEKEYPYSSMQILVKTEKMASVPETLEGMTGLITCSVQGGSGTSDDPYYLEGRQQINGNPGDVIYVYVQPNVNTGELPDGVPEDTLSYDQRYASFVQEYQFRIMENAAAPVISPSTVKTTENGEAASIEVDAEIYLTSEKNSDLILYSKTANEITPEPVTDNAVLEELEKLNQNTETISYYKDTEIQKFYVKNNGIWYVMDDSSSDLTVYEDGNLFFEMDSEDQIAFVSVIAFSEGYYHSSNDIYRYKVTGQGAVSEPTALLASGTTVSMGKALNFSSGSGTVIYYTEDGREPEIKVDPDTKEIQCLNSTKEYEPGKGIVLDADQYSYGSNVTFKMMACPVVDTSADTKVLNVKKKSSNVVSFFYSIAEQNQVETPTSYPETSQGNPLKIKKGDQIVLACATSGAEIYYTTDGNTPDISKEEQKYTSVIKAEGSYGGFFTVKAVAHKEGMKDSAVATFVYQIEEQEVVGGITATPGTQNHVIAGDKIILSAVTPGAEIFYTTDGSAPEVEITVNGSEISYDYSEPTRKYDSASPVVVPEGKGYFLINAVAVKPDMADSPVVQLVYTYADEVGAPYGNPSAGTVTENTEVILRSSTKDAVIYYEIAYGKEPADPTMNSAVFSEKAPVVITKDTVIKAFAVYERESSEIVTLKYTLAEKMQKPSASLNSGSIVPSGTIISFPSSDGTVYFTTDGSDPSDPKNTSVNSGSSVVITGKAEEKITINACTKKTGATTSEIVTWTYQISKYPGGVTSDTEEGKTLADGDIVHLITDVTGGTIYYTLGTGNPVNGGTAGNAVTISGEPGQDISLKAAAVAPGTRMTGSYAAFQYKLRDQLAAPHASIMTNTVLTEETNLILKANKGKIYYTIDGTLPDRNSYLYEYPIILYQDTTVQAIAMEDGYESSAVSIFVYTFAEKVKGLSASKPSGVLEAGETIWLTSENGEAEIYYTTNGSNPDPDAEEGTLRYSPADGIRVNRDVTIRAIAVQDNRSNSDVLTVSYTVGNVPAQDKKMEQAAAEEEGPKELNTEQLDSRWETSDTVSNSGIVTVHDVFGDAVVKGKASALSGDVKLNSKEIAVSDDAEKKVQNLLGKEYQFLNNYEFALYRGGEKIQPESRVTVGIPIPEEYRDADIFIVYSNDKGQITVFDTRREDGYAYADTDYIRNFGLVGAALQDDRDSRLNIILILTACAGILAVAGLGMIIGIKTKRKRFEES